MTKNGKQNPSAEPPPVDWNAENAYLFLNSIFKNIIMTPEQFDAKYGRKTRPDDQ